MIRFILIISSLMCTSILMAASSYQVDLIIFANPQTTINELSLDPILPFISSKSKAIPLGISSGKTSKSYQIMSPTQSGLKDQNYLLSRRSNYQVLGHFSWTQPTKSQSKVLLPKIDSKGWQIEGSLKVVQGNYYHVDAELQCSPPSAPDKSFTVFQHARVTSGELYYLDHQQINMLIKIHPTA